MPDDSAENGPLYQAALQRTSAVQNAPTHGKKARAFAGLVGVSLAGVAENYVRKTLVTGAILLSIFAAGLGIGTGEVGWAVPMVAAGVAGVVLVWVAVARHWSFARQWSVLLGVLTLQCVLIAAAWLTT